MSTITFEQAQEFDRLYRNELRGMAGEGIVPGGTSPQLNSSAMETASVLPLNPGNVPDSLRVLPQWVLWKLVSRDGNLTKVPYQPDGTEAKSNNPATWSPFEYVLDVYERGEFDGVGYVFSSDDDFCGIDLDGCRDPATGEVAAWVQEIITHLDSYAEVSPSGTGVKLFVRGRSPFSAGKSKKLVDQVAIGEKSPGIEVYDHGRYFAVTGQRIDCPAEPQERQAELDWLKAKFWPDDHKPGSAVRPLPPPPCETADQAGVERARRYLATIPPAISGQGGHNATFRVACVLVKGFGLSLDHASRLLVEWNGSCQPPWSGRELRHKLDEAEKAPGPVGYLRDVPPERWASVEIPPHQQTVGGKAEPPTFTRLLSGTELLALDLRPEFLVKGVLVQGQPMIMGGRSKVLKTSIAVDLAISLGSGTPFLGRFESKQARVGFWSGESGAATVRETAQRVAASKGVSVDGSDVQWCFDLPRLCQLDHLGWLGETIRAQGLRVAVFDPLYLALLSPETANGASNLFMMGSLLQGLTKLGQEAGCTVVVLHHFRKGGQPNDEDPAGLEELSQSGVSEWARQWILLQRRASYQGDGNHLLWMRCGGSAGHGSLWGVTIDEGIIDPENFEGRKWEVTTSPAADARAQAQRDREQRKATEQEKREGEQRNDILEALKSFPDGETAKGLREESGVKNSRNFKKAITSLLQEGRAVRCKVTKNKRPEDAFKPSGK